MIVRHTHWPWILFCLLAALACAAVWWTGPRHDPEGLTGGSSFGLWCGVLGSLCMIFAGILPLLRRRATVLNPHLPPRSWWLQGHIWVGLLSIVFIAFHSGFRLDGTVTAVLTLVYLAVVLSGIVGLGMQAVFPHRLTVASVHEVPPGQIEAVCSAWRKECDALVDQLCGPRPAFAAKSGYGEGNDFRHRLRSFYENQMRPGLREMLPMGWPLADETRLRHAFDGLRRFSAEAVDAEVANVLDRLEVVCQERLDLARQQRRYAWLHGWLPLHIGLSAALLVLGIVHVITALWY